MKAITLHQPWATLWVLLLKRHETRAWATGYRGVLAVHAGKRWTEEEASLLRVEPFRSALAPYLAEGPAPLPLGALVGAVHVDQVVETDGMAPFLTPQELAFGNWEPGRYGWHAREAWRLPAPIPTRGYQGLWDLPAPLYEQLRRAVVPVRLGAA